MGEQWNEFVTDFSTQSPIVPYAPSSTPVPLPMIVSKKKDGNDVKTVVYFNAFEVTFNAYDVVICAYEQNMKDMFVRSNIYDVMYQIAMACKRYSTINWAIISTDMFDLFFSILTSLDQVEVESIHLPFDYLGSNFDISEPLLTADTGYLITVYHNGKFRERIGSRRPNQVETTVKASLVNDGSILHFQFNENCGVNEKTHGEVTRAVHEHFKLQHSGKPISFSLADPQWHELLLFLFAIFKYCMTHNTPPVGIYVNNTGRMPMFAWNILVDMIRTANCVETLSIGVYYCNMPWQTVVSESNLRRLLIHNTQGDIPWFSQLCSSLVYERTNITHLGVITNSRFEFNGMRHYYSRMCNQLKHLALVTTSNSPTEIRAVGNLPSILESESKAVPSVGKAFVHIEWVSGKEHHARLEFGVNLMATRTDLSPNGDDQKNRDCTDFIRRALSTPEQAELFTSFIGSDPFRFFGTKHFKQMDQRIQTYYTLNIMCEVIRLLQTDVGDIQDKSALRDIVDGEIDTLQHMISLESDSWPKGVSSVLDEFIVSEHTSFTR